MAAVWVVPVLAVLFGGVAIAALFRGAAADTRELAREVARFGELNATMAGIRAELVRARTNVDEVRGRSFRQ